MVKLKKNSKILLLLVAIVSLFGFSMIFASDEPGKITISKSATKIYDDAGDDNLKKGRNAKVTLTVNGNPYTTSQTSMSKLDIVLVLDNSGSMAYGSRGKNDNSTPSRIASLESTANDFINTMLDKDGNVQIGLVTFSKDVNTSVSFSNYSKKNDLTTAINGMTANGGTNLQAGIEKAHDLLKDGGRNDAKKMVIILTDGIPTFFNYTYYDLLVICGTGDSDNPIPFCSNMRPSDAAKKELDDLKKDYSTADIYTITFGEEEEAASKLEKINPVETTENHTYKNEKALDANQLKKLFENISQSLKNVLATNGVVTDTIPSDFSLTDTAKKDLESKGVEVTENEDGTTTLKWNIGDISANNELSLTYEVRAKEEYHGSMYTNTKAVLTAKASDDNPFYENKDLSLEFEEPSVEIPAITKDDHYKDNSSYKGYSGGTINGTSILNNDLNKHIERESKEDVSVTDKIVIVENDNVKRIADNKYEIYKDSSLQGTLTINEDGTFTFNSSVDTIGEVSFDYYIESDITNPHETKDVESNTSTVTLLINERQKMSIDGKKIWEDDNNNDGLRQESVNVTLYADNEVIRTIDVAKSSDWKYSFNDLYVYRVGHENEESGKIVYRVAETQSYNGYSSSVDGYNITNKHEIEKTEVSGTKTWEDNNNQDGKRPESIKVNLLADGKVVDSKEVSAKDKWTYKFENLNVYKNGQKIKYTISEDSIEGYTTKINDYNITNKHEVEKTEVSGTKTWEDNNNQDGKRPESIKVNLLADGKVVDSKEVSAKDKWTYKFEDLNVYNNGQKIKYTISEENINGYTTEINGYNITNKHEIEKTEVSGTKTWDDNKNQDGKRPEKITVRLYANEKEVKSQEVKPDESGNWKYSFTGLNKYENGKEIAYTVKEDKVEGYTSTIDHYNITNKHEIEKAEVSGTKTWEDNNNQDGKRPKKITVRLYANGVEKQAKELKPGSDGKWNYSFTGLDKYSEGKEIKYIVKEDKVDGYETIIDGYNITNKHEIEKTEVSGTKAWEDNNNQDGKRPESITIHLLANGEEIKSQGVKPDESGNWKYSFTGLNKYENGKEITYTVKEDKVEGYTSTIDHYNITNKHEIEKTEVSGTKTWEDNNNQDGKRPESITINLLANGKKVSSTTATAASNWKYSFTDLNKYSEGKEITYTVKEDEVAGYEATINGNNITNKHEIEKTEVSGTKTWYDNNNQDGKRPESIKVNLLADGKVVDSKEVSAKDQWTYKFENLNVYNNGQKIKYTISEDTVEGYTTETNGYNITNKHEVEKTEVSGTKTWEDNNNQDGKRPESIKVNLLADGNVVDSKEVSAKDQWTYKFENLNVYNNGQKIKYTISEDTVEGYTTKISGYDITNIHTPQTIDINGKKIWNDSNNQDGKRPSSVTIQLYADGEKVEGQTATISGEGNNWDYSFKNLPMYKAGEIGHEIKYSVQEVNVDSNYSVQYDKENKFNIINTHDNIKTEVSGTKTWDDNNNQDGKRPEKITVRLYANGNEKESQEVKPGSDGKWNYSFTGLDKYSEGKEITYTVSEDNVEGYKTEISGNNITNIHNPEKISITGTKTWNDNNNQDGIRPDSITINLLANGEKVSSTIANSESNWNYSFTNLDKYNQGTEIKYALEEVSVDGYTSEITDFNITNTHTPETVSYILQKAWSDQDNNDGIRPEYIIVHLYADGYEKLSQKVTAASGWTYTFENLPKYNNGKLINYTFTEEIVKGYNSSIVINDNANNNQSTDRDKIIDNNQNDSNKSENTKNVTITNTHENEKNNITITKKWNDSDNIYNKRPDSIKVTIVGKVNGQIIVQKDIEITKNMDWLYITKDLDKYYKGQEIKYEIIEDEVGDYTTTYDGYNIINTYIKPAIGETSGEITPPNTGVETSNNNSLIIMLLILVSSFRFVLIKD